MKKGRKPLTCCRKDDHSCELFTIPFCKGFQGKNEKIYFFRRKNKRLWKMLFLKILFMIQLTSLINALHININVLQLKNKLDKAFKLLRNMKGRDLNHQKKSSRRILSTKVLLQLSLNIGAVCFYFFKINQYLISLVYLFD